MHQILNQAANAEHRGGGAGFSQRGMGVEQLALDFAKLARNDTPCHLRIFIACLIGEKVTLGWYPVKGPQDS